MTPNISNRSGKKTVHMIGHAHIDPVWLWQYQDGVDVVLATYRSACDLLDAYPRFIFSQGDAWTFQQVELLEPELFERIRAHVRAGRWDLVGGWWIQPDCNLPTGFGFERQIEAGKRYFLDRFGVFPKMGCNVDSFGHAASLPGYMRAAGQKFYVMMRPWENEMTLPARVFRWRGEDGGPEIVTYRIAGGYGWAKDAISAEHISSSLTQLPDGIEHTMCFYGVGDHGGGPTAANIRWIAENENVVDGCRIVFSSMSKFFEAIGGQLDKLPVVTGELQMHAVGCYTVERGIKTLLRRSEHALRQAEMMHASEPNPDANQASRIWNGWEHVCFNQFHDILAGTCIPSAYRECYAQLGHARWIADETLTSGLRRKMRSLPDDSLQRTVFFNASDETFEGYTEFEPWIERKQWTSETRLLDENGVPVSCQVLPPESVVLGVARILARMKLGPGEMTTLKIDPAGNEAATTAASVETAKNDIGVGIDLGQRKLSFPGTAGLEMPRLEIIEDLSDTWSHGIDRYAGRTAATDHWDSPLMLCEGPLMTALLQNGSVGQSRLQAQWRVYAGEPFVELRLRVHWLEKQKVLKLCLPLPAEADCRIDGIPGASLRRENDGKERPISDWTLFEIGNARLGIVCPETFALDASPDRVRFTLLRSPLMAHHDPTPDTAPAAHIADQGEHEFVFRFYLGEHVTRQMLISHSVMLQRPLITATITRGMPRAS